MNNLILDRLLLESESLFGGDSRNTCAEGSMRCFIGLPLPEMYQRLLAEITQEWQPRLGSGVSWTKPGNWHLTLKFLGELQEERVASLGEALRNLAMGTNLGEAIVIQGRGGGFFPNTHRPRVLWVGLGQGTEKIRILAARIESACADVGIAREQRPFQAHLTVARIKRPWKSRDGPPLKNSSSAFRGASWIEVLHALNRVAWPEVIVDRMVLWESRLSPEGPSYLPLEVWKLS